MATPDPVASVSRRQFLSAAGLVAGAAAVGGPLIIPSRTIAQPGKPGASGPAGSPNNQIGLAIIGTGKRGFELMDSLLTRSDCRIVAVCDVEPTRREAARKLVNDKYGNTDCAWAVDYREVLTKPAVDAVIIATPDHWHLNQVLHAAAAKKPIYCEKPLTLCLSEGRRMIAAVRKHNVVFQTGSQQRTEYDHRFVTACEYVRSGRLGKLYHVYVGIGLPSIPCDLPAEQPDSALDWDRWLGPAPQRPYHSELCPRGVHHHYPNWRLYREYSGGLMTDWGAHHYDIAQWGLGMDESGPVEIIPPAQGGATGKLDPKSEYGLRMVYASGVDVIHGGPPGVTFVGEKGSISVDRGRLLSIPEDTLKNPLGPSDTRLPRRKSQLDDWFDCIRSKQRCVCDVEVGARSIALAHLSCIGYWTGRRLKWDPAAWEFPGDNAANQWLDYERRKDFAAPVV